MINLIGLWTRTLIRMCKPKIKDEENSNLSAVRLMIITDERLMKIKIKSIYLSSVTWGVVARSPEPKAHVSNVRAFRIESEFRRRSWFLVEGKTGLPGGKPHGAEKRTNNKLDPHCNFESANRTPGHIVERRMLSPLHHACSLKIFLRSGNGLALFSTMMTMTSTTAMMMTTMMMKSNFSVNIDSLSFSFTIIQPYDRVTAEISYFELLTSG